MEIDARKILSNISPDAPALSSDELKAKAMEYIRATIPDFDALQPSWQYEEGVKGDNYFFNWYGEVTPGSMNRPFAQIGLNKNGVLFAYYNTLLLKNQPLYQNVAVSGIGESAYFNNGADTRQLWVKVNEAVAFVVANGTWLTRRA